MGRHGCIEHTVSLRGGALWNWETLAFLSTENEAAGVGEPMDFGVSRKYFFGLAMTHTESQHNTIKGCIDYLFRESMPIMSIKKTLPFTLASSLGDLVPAFLHKPHTAN